MSVIPDFIANCGMARAFSYFMQENIEMKDIEMSSMKTPSYPSGHSAQGMLIGLVLSDKYPKAKSAFMQTANNISDSRNIAHAHYKSDREFGKKLGKKMYNHIKNKI